MKALFVELPAFSRYRADYLDDEGFRALQNELVESPEKGDVIEGTGGLRKLRRPDQRRGKGKRGGLRVITSGGKPVGNSGCSLFTTRTKWKT